MIPLNGGIMKVIILMMALSFSAKAHFNIGWYKGLDQNGGDCFVKFNAKEYRFNIKNPLNEIVEVELTSGEKFGLVHLLKYNDSSFDVLADKDHLTGHNGTNYGAKMLQILMDDGQGNHWPQSYILVDHNWINKTKTVVDCRNLEFIETK